MSVNDDLSNDAPGNADTKFEIGIGEIVSGINSTSTDQDWFAVTLKQGVQYTFAMVGIGANLASYPTLGLRNANSAVLASVDYDSDNNNAILTFTATSDATYFLTAESSDAGTYKLSVAEGPKATYDAEMVAGAITSRWLLNFEMGDPVTVTFGFRQTAGSTNIENFQSFGTGQQEAMRKIIASATDVCGLVMQDVNPDGLTDNAQVLMGIYGNNDGGGYAYFPSAGGGSVQSVASDVWVSFTPTSNPVTAGTWQWQVLQHELGHALGLDHTGPYNGGGVTYEADAEFIEDYRTTSVMSYFSDNAKIPDGWMLADVIALQTIYGVNMTTRTGNTTYGYNGNAGGIFDFTTNSDPFLTIWDAGGIDTLDVSLFAGNQRIDLRGMTYSSVLGFDDNVAIAPGARIENARAGGGSDNVQGNELANRLWGNAGNDTLDGGAGGDSLTGGTGGDRLIGLSGRDRLDAGVDNSRDVFVFQSRSDSAANQKRDILLNFDRGEDIINLSAIDANTDKAGNQKFTGFGSRPGDHGVWAVQRDGSTILFADVTGDGRADFSLKLAGINSLGADSLLL